MQIYYDSKCKFCNKIRKFIEKIENKNYPKFNFLEIRESKYVDLSKKTIVVESENSREYFIFGEALQKIFAKTKFPYKLFAYLPSFFLKIIYIILREVRKYL